MMNREPKHLCLIVLFTLACSPIRAQQAATEIDQSKSAQATASTTKLTADGVPLCTEQLKWRSLPEGTYRVGGGVLPPIPTNTPEATFSNEGRKYARNVMKTQHIKRFEAKSLVRLTVDTNGLPQNLCVLNEMGHDFDRKAFDSVAMYRFHPATLEGKPVPVRLTVEVTFALW
jgi:outer membrane biosynthesis protein TonB